MSDQKAVIEALLFQSAEPMQESELQAFIGAAQPVQPLLEALQDDYRGRGIQLEQHGGSWAFRTSPDIAGRLIRQQEKTKKLSRAGLETLAIIAYQQPVTRAEIEAVRGTSVSRGTLDLLVEAGWVEPKGRRDTVGKPVTWVTTTAFLDYFDLRSLGDLPRLDELEAAGLFRPQSLDASEVAGQENLDDTRGNGGADVRAPDAAGRDSAADGASEGADEIAQTR